MGGVCGKGEILERNSELHWCECRELLVETDVKPFSTIFSHIFTISAAGRD